MIIHCCYQCLYYCLMFVLFSLSVLITIQPPYLHNLISVQPPRSTHSSSPVTFARPPTSSSIKITEHSFPYAFSFDSPLCSSITPSISLFHSQLKTYLFHKSFPPYRLR